MGNAEQCQQRGGMLLKINSFKGDGVGWGQGREKKVGKMSNCPTVRYRFDLLMVSADTMVDFKVRFLYRAILSLALGSVFESTDCIGQIETNCFDSSALKQYFLSIFIASLFPYLSKNTL